jgi:hypothetical protein
VNGWAILLAVLSVWDYPARQAEHERLAANFLGASRRGDTAAMYEASEKGVKLLPEDPTWAFNLACALAYRKDQTAAFEALERAIDLGFRDADKITSDIDLSRLADRKRLAELVKYARDTAAKPVLFGPGASVPTTCVAGETLSVGAQNLGWNFKYGCFEVKAKVAPSGLGGNDLDLYMNRDVFHSHLGTKEYPGLTEVLVDQEGRARNMGVNFPDMLFPYPVFGNCSRAFTDPVMWRSLPRALMTRDRRRLRAMEKFYLSNQIWVFPANADFPPAGIDGDCFMSVAPYWIVTAGASWSDLYYLKAALEISRTLKPQTKKEAVSRGLLAPLVQNILRRSLRGVTNEVDYLSARAHPTCMPPNGLDMLRLKGIASEMKPEEVPPVAFVAVSGPRPAPDDKKVPECIFATGCASSFILKDEAGKREFFLRAKGGAGFKFSVVHGEEAVTLETVRPDAVKVSVDTAVMTSRVDIAVFARSNASGWGAPSFVSFAKPVNDHGYSDPVFYPPPKPAEEKPSEKPQEMAEREKTQEKTPEGK